MRTILLVLSLALVQGSAGSGVERRSDREEILAVLDHMTRAMEERDTGLLAGAFAPGGAAGRDAPPRR